MYFGRFSCVHISGLSANQIAVHENTDDSIDSRSFETDTEYKSHMLIARDDGGWEYVRIKNELARHLCIGRRDAIDLAVRTAKIAQRIGRACHVMWFVGCEDSDHTRFNLPWYWIEAHDPERNVDRSNYKTMTVSDELLPNLGDGSGQAAAV